MTKILPLASLPDPLLLGLVKLHRANLPTLLAELGAPVLYRYYQIAQQEPSIIAFYALEEAKAAPEPLLGFCLGSPNPAELNTRLRSPLPWFAAQMIRLALTRPRLLWQLAQSAFASSDANRLAPGQIELTYLVTAPSARGRGLGWALLDKFLNSAHAAGYTSAALSVESDNAPALALYTRAGFCLTETFSEGRYQRCRMVTAQPLFRGDKSPAQHMEVR